MTRATGRRAAPTPADSVDGAHGRAELLRDADRRAAWMLLVDGVPQSHVDLDDPGYLDFEYVRRLGHVIDTAAPAAQPLRVLHLGAGALTLARYVTATRPGSTQLAVEVDAALVDLVRRRLPLRGVRVRIGDARAVLERLRAGSFDVVIADVFAGGRTPAHLTSVEFMTAVRRALRPGGVYARQCGRRGATRPRPGAGRDGAGGLSAGGAHRRCGGAARPEVREPGPGGEPGAAPGPRADPADGRGSDAGPGAVRRGPDPVRGRGQAGHRREREPLPRAAGRRLRGVSGAAGSRAADRRPGRLSRLARTRTETWIGLPSKPNSSRSRRSTNRR